MDDNSKLSVRNARLVGITQYKEFIKERFVTGEKSVHDVIKQNKLSLYRRKLATKRDTGKVKETLLKQGCHLFSSLFIAFQTRKGDIDHFFMHENRPYPPALSNLDEMRHNNKSDMLKIFSNKCDTQYEDQGVTAVVLDGAAIVQMIPPTSSKTFKGYCENEFSTYINIKVQNPNVRRIDIVFDIYKPLSIKAATREKRGSGKIIKVTGSTLIPKDWKTFLHVNENKEQLFMMLSEEIICLVAEGKQIVCTKNEDVLTNDSGIAISNLMPCNHEEADTRMLLHTNILAQCGHSKGKIITVDTDVIILAITLFSSLNIEELWIEFGSGQNRRWYPIHEIVDSIGRQYCEGILFQYAFTGCDSVSSFSPCGKIKAWETWSAYPGATECFIKLSTSIENLSEEDVSILERYVVLLYDRSSTTHSINECRKQLFAKKARLIENIPPTKDALYQHISRAVYQAGFV